MCSAADARPPPSSVTTTRPGLATRPAAIGGFTRDGELLCAKCPSRLPWDQMPELGGGLCIEGGDECPVCYERIKYNDAVECRSGHRTCNACYRRMIGVGRGTVECPMCREQLRGNNNEDFLVGSEDKQAEMGRSMVWSAGVSFMTTRCADAAALLALMPSVFPDLAPLTRECRQCKHSVVARPELDKMGANTYVQVWLASIAQMSGPKERTCQEECEVAWKATLELARNKQCYDRLVALMESDCLNVVIGGDAAAAAAGPKRAWLAELHWYKWYSVAIDLFVGGAGQDPVHVMWACKRWQDGRVREMKMAARS